MRVKERRREGRKGWRGALDTDKKGTPEEEVEGSKGAGVISYA